MCGNNWSLSQTLVGLIANSKSHLCRIFFIFFALDASLLPNCSALINFLFSESRAHCLRGPQAGDSRLFEEIQCPTEIKGKRVKGITEGINVKTRFRSIMMKKKRYA